MKLLDAKTSKDAVRLGLFMLTTGLATALLVVLIGNFTFGSKRTYHAVFSDATGVVKGDDVRIAGVKVGSVKSLEVLDRTRAMITFDVLNSAVVTRSSEATIKYRNLVGQRFISLSEGVGNTTRLPAEATIPISRTEPALDLTVLFNGFKPLFAALSPTDINKLSYEIVQVFQGEGSTVEGLLGSTASLTQTLASRDRVIGELITNLNDVLTTVSERDTELSDLIVRLRTFVTGLKNDRQAILGSLDDISALSVQTSQLVSGIRPGLVNDVKQLRKVTGNINANADDVNTALGILPIKLRKIGRTALYGSFFNFYLCELRGSISIKSGVGGLNLDLKTPVIPTNAAERCNPANVVGAGQ